MQNTVIQTIEIMLRILSYTIKMNMLTISDNAA